MTIKEALYSYLQALVSLASLVGDRIHFGERPQSEVLPAVSFFQQSGAAVQTATGGGDTGIRKFQVECWGSTAAEADSVANAIKGTAASPALDAFVSSVMGTLFVNAARVDDISDSKELPQAGETKADHKVTLEVTLWHDEA